MGCSHRWDWTTTTTAKKKLGKCFIIFFLAVCDLDNKGENLTQICFFQFYFHEYFNSFSDRR